MTLESSIDRKPRQVPREVDPYTPIELQAKIRVNNRNMKPKQRSQITTELSNEDSLYYNTIETGKSKAGSSIQ